MHIILAGIGVISVLLAVIFGAAAFGKRFKFYSIVTIMMLLAPGILTFMSVPQAGTGQYTPWLGLTERISTYAYLVWEVVLAIVPMQQARDTGKMLRISS